jgi:hypothetical protein
VQHSGMVETESVHQSRFAAGRISLPLDDTRAQPSVMVLSETRC